MICTSWVQHGSRCETNVFFFFIFHVIDTSSICVDNRELSAKSMCLVSGTHLLHINGEQKLPLKWGKCVGRLWQWHRQPCWGVGRGNSLIASFNTVLLLSSLEWVLFTFQKGLKSYKPQSLQCSSQTTRKMFVSLAHVWERAEILAISRIGLLYEGRMLRNALISPPEF